MKHIIVCSLLLVGSLITTAQDRAKDEKQINDRIDAMINDWGRL